MIENPGVLVIGGDHSGLGILTSLNKRGISTCLVDYEFSIGRFSRYTEMSFKCPHISDEKRFLEFLKDLATKNNLEGWVICAYNDETIYFLSRHKSELEQYYRIPTPDWEITRLIYDKKLTYQIAEEVGVPTPKTICPDTIDELMELDLSFPLIIKPSVKANFYNKVKRKALRVENREELRTLYERICEVIPASEVMIQQLISGGPLNLFSFCPLFKDGQVLAYVTARRTRQHPMDFGHATTFAETVDIPELEELGTRMLSAIDYYGVAEVEFMRDPLDGEFKLIEINGRFWGWHTLTGAAGVDMPYLLYRDMIGEEVGNHPFIEGVKWIRPITDTPTAAFEILKGKLKLVDYLTSVRGKKEIAPAFSIKDPVPFLIEFMMLPYLWKNRGF